MQLLLWITDLRLNHSCFSLSLPLAYPVSNVQTISLFSWIQDASPVIWKNMVWTAALLLLVLFSTHSKKNLKLWRHLAQWTNTEAIWKPTVVIPAAAVKILSQERIAHFDIAQGQVVILRNCWRSISSSSVVGDMYQNLKLSYILRINHRASLHNLIIHWHEPFFCPFFRLRRNRITPTHICITLWLQLLGVKLDLLKKSRRILLRSILPPEKLGSPCCSKFSTRLTRGFWTMP